MLATHTTATAALIALFGASVLVQRGAPPTDVFLATLRVRGDGLTLGKPVNISESPGYDNQPSFTPDSAAVLFTSVRGAGRTDPATSAASGSDIYRYDIRTKQLTQVTSTTESEYSPTVAPDGKSFSVIQVEADGTQRLWRFPLDGGPAALVLADIKPVGYHAWIGESALALFVLGQPPTLQVADTRTGRAEVVAKGIGRSLQRIPGGGISFVRIEADAAPMIMELQPSTKSVTPLVRAMQGVREPDLAWTPEGWLLLAHAGSLHGWRRGDAAFRPLAELEALGLRGVSRLAVSPDSRYIALVAQP